MDFVTAVKTCFSKYATFSGRASRSEFWYWILFVSVAGTVFNVVDFMIFGEGILTAPATLGMAFSLFVALPGLAVSARRLHDVGRSGWWQLIMLTGVGIILLAVWWASKSKEVSHTVSENSEKA